MGNQDPLACLTSVVLKSNKATLINL